MKTKIAAVILALCLCAALLSGCGGGSSTASSYEPAVPAASDMASTLPAETGELEYATPELDVETSIPSEEEIVLAETYLLDRNSNYPLNCFAFSDDVTWAALIDENTHESALGVINKRGEVLYLVGRDEKPEKITPFLNGLAVIDNSVINQYGEKVFSTPDDTFKIIGYANDGTFFLSKHTDASFDTQSSDYLYIMGSDLKLQETGIEIIRDEVWGEIERLADGFYYISYVGDGDYINLNDNVWICASRGDEFISRNDWPKSYNADYAEIGIRNTFLVPLSKLVSCKSLDEITFLKVGDSSVRLSNVGVDGWQHGYGEFGDKGLLDINLDENAQTKSWKLSDYMDNSLLRKVSHGNGSYYDYIDLSGNTLFRYPDFPEGISYLGVDDFSGGYSALYLKGVDNNSYVTIIDESGNIQYDPVKFHSFCSCNGYIIGYQNSEDEPMAVTPTGEVKKLGVNLSRKVQSENPQNVLRGQAA